MKRSFVFLALVIAALLPASAHGLTMEDLQKQIALLLTQVTTLQEQLRAYNNPTVLPQTILPSQQSNVRTVCPIFRSTFAKGYSGPAVSELQKILVTRGHLTSDSVTGYFGARTELALQRLQAEQGLVTSGSPSATGWGVAGPRTREMLTQMCAASFPKTLTCSPTSQPLTACSTGWTVITDIYGCTAGFQCISSTVSTSTSPLCSTYQRALCAVDEELVSNGFDANGCARPTVCARKITRINCPIYSPPLCSANEELVGGGTGSDGCQAAPRCVPKNTNGLSVSPTSGSAPLTVMATFPSEWQALTNAECSSTQMRFGGRTFSVDWGDGTFPSQNGRNSPCKAHTYTTSGAYVVKGRIYDFSDVNEFDGSFTRDVWTGTASVTVTGGGAVTNQTPSQVVAKYRELYPTYSTSLGVTVHKCTQGSDVKYTVEGSGGFTAESHYFDASGSYLGKVTYSDTSPFTSGTPPFNKNQYSCVEIVVS